MRASISRASSRLTFARASSRLSISSVATTAPVKRLIDVDEGDLCETLAPVTLRMEQALESEEIMLVAQGVTLEVVEIGEARRVKVKRTDGTDYQGWISTKTKAGEALIKKLGLNLEFDLEDFDVGGCHEVKQDVTIRVGESLDSEEVQPLKDGTLVRITEVGLENKRRVKITTGEVEGWVSLASKTGVIFLGKPSSESARTPTSPGSPGKRSSFTKRMSTMFQKSPDELAEKAVPLLEAARSGDLDALEKEIARKGIYVNGGDRRGKTALMFASAFGSKDCVEHLLMNCKDVDVHEVDDTGKTALHHGCRRARSIRIAAYDEDILEIVRMLLRAGASVDARDHKGCTPLMFAVSVADEAVVRELLKLGADVNIKDHEMNFAVDYAIYLGHQGLRQILVDAGAIIEDGSPIKVNRKLLSQPAAASSPGTSTEHAADPVPSPDLEESAAAAAAAAVSAIAPTCPTVAVAASTEAILLEDVPSKADVAEVPPVDPIKQDMEASHVPPPLVSGESDDAEVPPADPIQQDMEASHVPPPLVSGESDDEESSGT